MRDVDSLNGGPDWKTEATDREPWRTVRSTKLS